MTSTIAFQQIDRIERSIEILFGASREGKLLRQSCQEARKEIQAIATRRELHTLGIALIGSKNVGKSWLCRRLIRDQANRERIPCGEESSKATTVATWIGPTAPRDLDSLAEVHIPMSSEAMIDLAMPYVLLDLPGYNDASLNNRESALKAIHGASLRILVTSSQTIADESQWAYLKESDGTCILPVVVDNNYPAFVENENADLVELVRRLRTFCPSAQIADPIVIPHVEHSSGTVTENTEIAEQKLLPALRELAAQPETDPSLAVSLSFERFRGRISRELNPWMNGIVPAYQALIAEESGMASQIIGKMVGTESQLTSGIRMKMRMLTVTRTPAGFFPYRTILGLFGLTAGAWDRLAFAMAGSLPSLALLALQTSRNIKSLGEGLREVKLALAGRIEAMASERLEGFNQVFVRSIGSFLPNPIAMPRGDTGHVRLSGLDIVTEKSAEIFEQSLVKYSPGRLLTTFWGGLATVSFFGLGFGPAVAVYREFVGVWIGVFQKGEAIRWQAFPTPSGSMIFSTLLLMILPVVLCALVTIARSAPKWRVVSAVEEIKNAHQTLISELATTKAVRLVSDDPTREAVRFLLDFIKIQAG